MGYVGRVSLRAFGQWEDSPAHNWSGSSGLGFLGSLRVFRWRTAPANPALNLLDILDLHQVCTA